MDVSDGAGTSNTERLWNLLRYIGVVSLGLRAVSAPAVAQGDPSATLTIYRPKVVLVGRALHPVIYCNGSRLAALPAGRFFTIQIKLGITPSMLMTRS
jgi:hypothetical protein